MKIKNCKIGTLVIHWDDLTKKYMIGHITDLIVNCTGEVIPVVNFAVKENETKRIFPVHPNNIEVLK